MRFFQKQITIFNEPRLEDLNMKNVPLLTLWVCASTFVHFVTPKVVIDGT